MLKKRKKRKAPKNRFPSDTCRQQRRQTVMPSSRSKDVFGKSARNTTQRLPMLFFKDSGCIHSYITYLVIFAYLMHDIIS